MSQPKERNGKLGYLVELEWDSCPPIWVSEEQIKATTLEVTLPGGQLSGFHERLIVERAQVADKLIKLTAFIGTMPFLKLGAKQQTLLEQQLEIMIHYRRVLDQRILDLSLLE